MTLPLLRAPFRCPLGLPLLLGRASVLLALTLPLSGGGGGAGAQGVDEMNDASGFYNATDAAAVEAADGVVKITKNAMADAFLRWNLAGRADGGIPLDAAHDLLEIDFAEFPGSGLAEVRIGMLDADRKSHAPVWLDKHAAPGKATLPSVSAFAASNGVVGAQDYHLFLRVASPPPGGFVID